MPTNSRIEHIVTVTVHQIESPMVKHGEDYTLKFKRGDTVSTFEPVASFYGKVKCPSSWRHSAVVHFKSGGKGPNGFQPKLVVLELHQIVKGKASKQIGTIQIDVTAALDDGQQSGARRQVIYTFRASGMGAELMCDLQVYPTGQLPPELPAEIGLPKKAEAEVAANATNEQTEVLDDAAKAQVADLEEQIARRKRLVDILEKAKQRSDEYVKLALQHRAENVAVNAIESGDYVPTIDPNELTPEHRMAISELATAQDALAASKANLLAAETTRALCAASLREFLALGAKRDELLVKRMKLNEEQGKRDVSQNTIVVMAELEDVENRFAREQQRLSSQGTLEERNRLNALIDQLTIVVRANEAHVEAIGAKMKVFELQDRQLVNTTESENRRVADEAAKQLTLFLAMSSTPEGYADLQEAAVALRGAPPTAMSPSAATTPGKAKFDAFGAMDATAHSMSLNATVVSVGQSPSPHALLLKPAAVVEPSDLLSQTSGSQQGRSVGNQSMASVSGQPSHGDDLFGSISSAVYTPPKAQQPPGLEGGVSPIRGARASVVPCPPDMDIFGAPLAPEAPGPNSNVPIGRSPTPQAPPAVPSRSATPPAATVVTPARSPAVGDVPDFFSGVPEKTGAKDASRPKPVWADDASLFGPTAVAQTARPKFYPAGASFSSEAAGNWAPSQSLSGGAHDTTAQPPNRRASGATTICDSDLFADVVPVKHTPMLHPAHVTVRATTPPPVASQQVNLFSCAAPVVQPPQKKPAFDPFATAGFADAGDDQLFA